MKANESILTEDHFKEEESKLYPQNTIDGSQLIDKPTIPLIPSFRTSSHLSF
jgi:hypothetical protein